MAITVTDTTVNPVIVVSGGTIKPLAAVTINDPNIGDTSDVVAEWADSTITKTDVGKFADPNGGGTVTGLGTIVPIFEEKATNTGTPSAGTTILQRLDYTAPTLQNGQFLQIIDALIVQDAPSGQFVVESPPQSPLIDIVTPPAIAGNVANQPVGAPGTIKPFSTVTITDGDFGAAKDTATITVSDGGKATDDLGLLTGGGLSKTGVGTYTLSNPTDPATLQTELQSLTFTIPSVFDTHTAGFSLAVTDVPPAGATPPPNTDLTKALTTTDTTTSVSEIGQPMPPAGNNFHMLDVSTGKITDTPGVPFTGPVPNIKNQLIVQDQFATIDKDNLNITAVTPNVFIHSGSGTDALDVSSTNGTNILDGFTGSNFLVGGTGNDTFFLDDRNATADIFSTVRNFHSGEMITVWGVTKGDFTIKAADNVLPNVPGLDFAITSPGKANTNLDIPNYTKADLSNGKLVVGFGKSPDTPGLPGSDFWFVQAT